MGYLRGLDISFDGNATAIKKAGFDFAMAELMIGTSTNPSGPRNVEAFRKAGLLAGGYVYAIYARQQPDGTHAVTDPVVHAKAFCALLAQLTLDFAPMLDVEQPRGPADQNLPLHPDEIIGWCEAYTDYVESETGLLMPVYLYPAYAKMLGTSLTGSSKLGRLPFAPASYPKGGVFPQPGDVPQQLDPASPYHLSGPWSDWALWQTAGNVVVPGIPHIVDVDVFNGTADDLRALGRTTPKPIDDAPVAVVHPDVPMPPPDDEGGGI